MNGPVRPVLPLVGPFDEAPAVRFDDAYPMLQAAVEGLPMGAYDRLEVDGLRHEEYQHLAWLASMLRRSFDAGVSAGRAEAGEELASVEEWREVTALIRKLRDGGAR